MAILPSLSAARYRLEIEGVSRTAVQENISVFDEKGVFLYLYYPTEGKE